MLRAEAVSRLGILALSALLIFLVGICLAVPYLMPETSGCEDEGWKGSPTVSGSIILEGLEGPPEYFIAINESDLSDLCTLKAALDLAANSADPWISYETTDYHVEKTMGYLEVKLGNKYGADWWRLSNDINMEYSGNFYSVHFAEE